MILGVEGKAMQRSGKALSVKKSELKCASGYGTMCFTIDRHCPVNRLPPAGTTSPPLSYDRQKHCSTSSTGKSCVQLS